jgi:hypothetical protein
MITPAHQRYNEFVQQVQREAAAWHAECRVHAVYHDKTPPRGSWAYARGDRDPNPKLLRAELQVYWDGKWHTIASEVPFTLNDDERRVDTYPDRWLELQSRMARELSAS